MGAVTLEEAPIAADRGGILGHPRALVYLCFGEAWERFSHFGMQSLLVLYMLNHLLPEATPHVVAFDPLRGAIERVTGPLSNEAFASQVFGL
jgi:POT family proton-dependent oligopeptide transporter